MEADSISNSVQNKIPKPWESFDVLHGQLDADDVAKDSQIIGLKKTGEGPYGSYDVVRGKEKPDEPAVIHDFSEIKDKPTELEIKSEEGVLEKTDEELKDIVTTFFDAGDYESAFAQLGKIKSKRIINKISGGFVLKLVDLKKFDIADRFCQLIDSDKDLYTQIQEYIREEEAKNISINPSMPANENENALDEFLPDKSKTETVESKPIDADEADPLSDLVPNNDPEPLEDKPVETIGVPEGVDEADKKIEEQLENTRKEYAVKLVEWKNNIRDKKSKYRKILADLGVDRQLPLEPEPEELVEARNNYILAKKRKNENLINSMLHAPNQEQRPLGLFEAEASANRDKLMSEIEKEFEELQKIISKPVTSEGNPAPQEKQLILENSLLGKGLNAWMKLGRTQRIAFSTVLIFGGGIAFGGLGIVGSATYAGYRGGKSLARSAVGTTVAQGVGKIADIRFKKQNEEEKNKAFDNYTREINLDNFAEKEKEIMRFLEEEKDEKKRQTLKKALLMGITAGATNIGLSIADNLNAGKSLADIGKTFSENSTPSSGGASLVDKIPEGSPVVPETLDPNSIPVLPNTMELKPLSLESFEAVANNEGVAQTAVELQVDLSSRGFIQDIHNLKAGILSAYHDKPIPDEVQKKILSVPSTKLAEQLGLYDSVHNSSGTGFKGEHLVFKDGKIIYDELGSDDKVLMDLETGEINKFNGEMVVRNVVDNAEQADGVVTPEVPTASTSEVLQDDPVLTVNENELVDTNIDPNTTNPEEVRASVDSVPEKADGVTPSVFKEGHIALNNGKFIDVVDLNGQKAGMIDGLPIAHEEGGLLVLDDKYQDGQENVQIRELYNQYFESTAKDTLGQKHIAESFEGGKIYTILGTPSDPNKVSVLLNGKEIATGSIKDGIPKFELHKNLKGPWYLSDNSYVRAFNHIKKIVRP